MSKKTIRKGAKVIDRWWTSNGIGIVKEILKTRIKIQFWFGLITYDNAHLQFLEDWRTYERI